MHIVTLYMYMYMHKKIKYFANLPITLLCRGISLLVLAMIWCVLLTWVTQLLSLGVKICRRVVL